MSFPVSLEVLFLFCLTELAFSASPGPAVFVVVSRAMRGGMPSATASALGVLAGNLLYFGLSATAAGAVLFALREWFFAAQWCGAAYLLWLAARMFRGGGESVRPENPRAAAGGALREGLLLQLANPKTLVFFIAFLPLFLDAGRPAAGQILVLAAASFLVESLVLLVYAMAARRSVLLLGGRFEKALSRGGALLLCAAALSLLFISA